MARSSSAGPSTYGGTGGGAGPGRGELMATSGGDDVGRQRLGQPEGAEDLGAEEGADVLHPVGSDGEHLEVERVETPVLAPHVEPERRLPVGTRRDHPHVVHAARTLSVDERADVLGP